VSFAELGIAALGLYLLAMLGVAELAKRARRDASPSDHFLAGRELGVFVLFLTLYATAYSGNSLLGYPGRAYRSGFEFVMATGFMLSIIVVFHSLAPKLRPLAVRHGFVTPGDWLRLRFGSERAGRWLVLVIGALMTAALANFLLAQLQAMGKVTSLVSDGLIPHSAGVIGLALMILFYETRGGMRAVAWTDAGQAILMLVGLLTLLVWLLSVTGGMGTVTRAVAEIRPAAVAVPDAQACARWFSTIALLGLASVVYPQAIQRIFAARSGRVLARSFALMNLMPLVTTLVVTLIGIAAIARLDLPTDVAADGVLPELLRDWASEGGLSRLGAVLVFLGALSAIMSTADSCLLSLGSLLSRDLLGNIGSDAAATRRGKLLAGTILLATIPFAVLEDISLWRLLELKMELLIQCSPAFLLAIHWQRQTAAATLVGVVVGTLFAVGLTLSGIPSIAGVHVGVIGVLLNTAVTVAGSLMQDSGEARALA
jgi:Na+/proline symporter